MTYDLTDNTRLIRECTCPDCAERIRFYGYFKKADEDKKGDNEHE